MHSDLTLAILDKETTVVGRLLRTFNANTCAQFKTKELRREAEARQRKSAKAAQGGQSSSSTVTTRKSRSFNMNTYKVHALGDYVETIKTYGTTDSYSTEPVGGLHWFWFTRTWKLIIFIDTGWTGASQSQGTVQTHLKKGIQTATCADRTKTSPDKEDQQQINWKQREDLWITTSARRSSYSPSHRGWRKRTNPYRHIPSQARWWSCGHG